MGFRMLRSQEFKEIFSRVPRLCVEVVIKREDGIILTLRSIDPYKGQWHIPGGTVCYGETLESAVKRVAKEEIGVRVEIKEMLGYIEYPDEEKLRGFGWSVGIAFLVKIKSGDLRGSIQGEKVGVFRKIPPNTIKWQKLFLYEKELVT